jgi:endonuclease YncB( thermonuclease family)
MKSRTKLQNEIALIINLTLLVQMKSRRFVMAVAFLIILVALQLVDKPAQSESGSQQQWGEKASAVQDMLSLSDWKKVWCGLAAKPSRANLSWMSDAWHPMVWPFDAFTR